MTSITSNDDIWQTLQTNPRQMFPHRFIATATLRSYAQDKLKQNMVSQTKYWTTY